jgi:hypothetical protein
MSKLYLYQYRREQRVEFEIEADTDEEADKLANVATQGFNLSSPDDTSDDPGEMEVLEVYAEGTLEAEYEEASGNTVKDGIIYDGLGRLVSKYSDEMAKGYLGYCAENEEE